MLSNMQELEKHIKTVKVPKIGDKIYKDECVWSFDTPVSIFLLIR